MQDLDAEMVYLNPAALKLLGFGSLDEALSVGRDGILRAFDTVYDDAGKPLPVEMLPGRQALRGEAGTGSGGAGALPRCCTGYLALGVGEGVADPR